MKNFNFNLSAISAIFLIILFTVINTVSCKKENPLNNKRRYELLINTPRKLIQHIGVTDNGETDSIMSMIVDGLGYDCYTESIYEFKTDSVYNNYDLCTPYTSKWYFSEDSAYINIWEVSILKAMKDSGMVLSKKKILILNEDILKIEYDVPYESDPSYYVATQTYETLK